MLLIGLFSMSFTSFSQQNVMLKQADSLFQARQYTQSFDLYQELLKTNRYSPSMLLKMAFIQEGLDHAGYALYYLNLYYLSSGDEQALEKMEELAERKNLKGYENSQLARVLFVIQKNSHLVSFALAALTLLMVAFMVYRKKKEQKFIGAGVITVILIIFLLIQTNLPNQNNTAIVANQHTYLMDGPSAGANVVSIIGEGHRLSVISKKDVWLQVRWLDKDVFIKENQVLPVTL